MITGSHNPKGVQRLQKPSAAPALWHGETIQEVRKLIESRRFRQLLRHGTQTIEPCSRTATISTRGCPPQFHFARLIKVVTLTPATAPRVHFSTALLERPDNCDATWSLFFDSRTVASPKIIIPTWTVPTNLKHTLHRRAVKANYADFESLAFDGDSDRIGRHRRKRRRDLRRHAAALSMAAKISPAKPGATFIGEVKCSQLLYDGELEAPLAATRPCTKPATRSSKRR